MSIPVLKVTGNTFVVNSTPNTVPTNAASPVATPYPNTMSGEYGSNTVGGATALYVVCTGTGVANVTVSNAGVNSTITMLAQTSIILTKYPNDTVASTPNVIATPVAFRT